MSRTAVKRVDASLEPRADARPSADGAASAPPPAPERAEDPREYLGPARVTAVEGGEITAAIPGAAGSVPVTPAFVLPYRPAVGDTLLVIGRGERRYAIGVLHGAGTTTLALQGDVEIHARDGSLSLSGDKGVAVRAPEITVEVGKARLVADAVVQKLNSLYQRVTGLLSVRAGEAHTVIEETSFTKAKNATILTEETATVNGKQILLG